MSEALSSRPEQAARWLAEALETGFPLAHLPPEARPADIEEAQDTALAVLEALEITPCGLRLLRRPEGSALAGPMVEQRLLRNGALVATEMLRHAQVSAAVIGVLAQDLLAGADSPPVFAQLHPALDVAASRYTALPDDALLLTADLARIGLVVAGRAKVLAPGLHDVALVPKGKRARGTPCDLAAALLEAASAARRLGGLPAGALLVVAGLTPPMAIPQAPGEALRVQISGMGSAEAVFSPQSSAVAAAPDAAAKAGCDDQSMATSAD